MAHQEGLATWLGADICPGTLNITLDRPLALRVDTALAFAGEGGESASAFWEAEFRGHRCLIRRWRYCPLHVVELVSPLHLRSAFGLGTGDRVVLEIPRRQVEPLGVRRGLAWASLWMARRHRFYRDVEYARAVEEMNPRACRLAGQSLPASRAPVQ